MLKRLALVLAVGLATVALAHHILAIGSYGRGTATTHDGRVGTFHYSVSKRTAQGRHPMFEGSLRFEQHANHHGPYVLIQMDRPAAVAVNGHAGEFSGPGSLTRTVKGHHQTVHGTVSVFAHDRRNPHHNPHGDPDVFRIHFTDKHNTTFSFDGSVHSGDLVVFSRQEH